MDWLVAILLGFIQGVTEFLPVSSSGHLILAGGFINLGNHFALDVLLNIGTLSALLWFFRDKVKHLLQLVYRRQFGLPLKLALATLPAVLVGFWLEDKLVSLNTNVLVVAVMLASVGGLMLVVKARDSSLASLESITWNMAFIVGCAQTVALIPGTSRAGVTILAALLIGMSASLAVEWSFLMAAPIVAVAIIRVMFSPEGLVFVTDNLGTVFVGNVVSFVAGLVAVSSLVHILKSKSLRAFGLYRLGMAGVLLIFMATSIL